MTVSDELDKILKKNSWMHMCNPACPNGCDRHLQDEFDPDVYRLVNLVRTLDLKLDNILGILSDGQEVSYDTHEDDLTIARRRGLAMEAASTRILDLEDLMLSILTKEPSDA